MTVNDINIRIVQRQRLEGVKWHAELSNANGVVCVIHDWVCNNVVERARQIAEHW